MHEAAVVSAVQASISGRGEGRSLFFSGYLLLLSGVADDGPGVHLKLISWASAKERMLELASLSLSRLTGETDWWGIKRLDEVYGGRGMCKMFAAFENPSPDKGSGHFAGFRLDVIARA
jgi:hypothetical protein